MNIFNKIFNELTKVEPIIKNKFSGINIKNGTNSMITINGKSISYSGNGSISIVNGKVIVDGKRIDSEDSKTINITILGDIKDLNIDYCETISVSGTVGDLQTTSGDVNCKDISGDVQSTSGNIECGNVNGSVKTVSGNVRANEISGSTKTVSGDIKTNKI